MAVSMESHKPRMMMDNILQDMMTTGRAALSPTSAKDVTDGQYFTVGNTTECPARINLILDCLNTPTGESLKSRDRNSYVITRGFGMTSFVYLAMNGDEKTGK